MSNDPSPMNFMGTQSRETVDMAAAMALAADPAREKVDDAVDDAGRGASAAGRKIGDAAGWVMGKAKDTLHSAAGQVRERTKTAVATYTRADPIRAVLVAAATGALLMGLVAMMARSGVRKVKRTVQR